MMNIRAAKAGLVFLCLVILAGTAQAQVKLDMSKVTCQDYALMSPEGMRDFGAWMSGWFNAKAGRTEVNKDVYETNSLSVRNWCGSHPTEQIMPMLETAVRDAKRVEGGPTSMDLARVTCADFKSYVLDTRLLVAAWASGYVAAGKNATQLDLKRLARQQNAILSSCKKGPKQTLLAVVGKIPR